MTDLGPLSVALALAFGMLAQTAAQHLAVPGIVLLLGAGVLLGPDGAGLIRPGALGSGLPTLVGFSVAVILFEGGLNLDVRRLRREGIVIRRLITWGALITLILGTATAALVLRWDLRTAALFGTIVIVTGPTVITPLVRRIRLAPPLGTILEAEGVLIDAVGALVAVVALETAIHPTGLSVATGIGGLLVRLAVGAVVGVAGGGLIALFLRWERVVPERLQSMLTLSLALATFQISNTLRSESGIVAAIAAGIVVGNVHLRVQKQLMEFKEQLTLLLLGMIFTLLAADIRVADVVALGWPGVIVVGILMFVVRPVGVLAATAGTGLSRRERIFLSWLAPRGIVAAAVASLFAQAMVQEGLPHATDLRALVFMVIGITVVVQGLSGGVLAGWLGLRRRADKGFVLVGANAVGRALAQVLTEAGEEALFIDADPLACRAAEEQGLRVIYGSALDERTLQRANLEVRKGFVAMTHNEGVNLLCARHARDEFRVAETFVAVDRRHLGVTTADVDRAGFRVLFGSAQDLERWAVRCDKGGAVVEHWRLGKGGTHRDVRGTLKGEPAPDDPRVLVLPLLIRRRGKTLLMDQHWVPRAGDELVAALDKAQLDAAHGWLTESGWTPIDEAELKAAAAARERKSKATGAAQPVVDDGGRRTAGGTPGPVPAGEGPGPTSPPAAREPS